MGPEMPPDLDREAKKKWAELVGSCDPDVDAELLANYCRQHSTLLAIRSEKAKRTKGRTFETLVAGRDGTMVLNPLLVTENRLIASLNRMLRTLGLVPSPEEKRRRPPLQADAPPGCTGPEPPWGWALEMALCGPIDEVPIPAPGSDDADWASYSKARGRSNEKERGAQR